MRDSIDFWNAEISKNNAPEIIESAFLRLYIEYEVYLANTFVTFALGSSYTSYLPHRKLAFSDATQLAEVIRGDSQFVDYIKAIPRCSKHIFQKNPFDLVFNSRNYNDDLLKMKHIRNYLAHRSSESLLKYRESVLKTYSIDDYMDPGVFLLRKVNNKSFTFYTMYCNIFIEIYEIFRNDVLLNGI